MTYWRGAMFNRKARRGSPDLVLGEIGIGPGLTVLDVGAGGGFFTFEFSRVVGPAGKVIAVDTDVRALDEISDRASRSGIGNVDTEITDGGCPSIPEGSVDIVFMRNVLHHISDPVGYFRDLKKLLKDGGRMAIIDYRGKDGLSFHSLFHHCVDRGDLILWARSTGFRIVREMDLPGDEFFLIFCLE